jgi:hypothetical protein
MAPVRDREPGAHPMRHALARARFVVSGLHGVDLARLLHIRDIGAGHGPELVLLRLDRAPRFGDLTPRRVNPNASRVGILMAPDVFGFGGERAVVLDHGAVAGGP